VKTVQQPEDAVGAATAMSNAIALKPDAIVAAGNPVSVFPQQVATMKRDGIAYIPIGTTDPIGNGVTADVGNVKDFQLEGRWLANWVVADSGGKANSVIFTLNTFPVLQVFSSTYQSTVQSLCSACRADVQSVAATAIGTTLPSEVVSYLRAHPSVNYAAFAYGDMTIGLASALQQANLSDRVKVATQSGAPSNYEDIAAGTEAVNVPESSTQMGFIVADALARTFMKLKLPQNQYAVVQHNFVVKSNVQKPPTLPYTAVPNFEQQFYKLWKVS
jgi:ribose transport system substrate-binding protein